MKSDVPQGYIKVGRLRQTIAKAIGRKCADIFISESHVRHIAFQHSTELEQIGIGAIEYVRMIVSNFNEIREGSGQSILLVVRCKGANHAAAIDLNYSVSKGFWEVRTAQPRSNADIVKRKKLWR